MYGAFELSRISWRLLFSITIVNTVPALDGGAAEAGGLVSGSHVASVSPDVLAQPAKKIRPRTTARGVIDMLRKLVLETFVDKRNVCGAPRDTAQEVRWTIGPLSVSTVDEGTRVAASRGQNVGTSSDLSSRSWFRQPWFAVMGRMPWRLRHHAAATPSNAA